jgi:hypothetical protein
VLAQKRNKQGLPAGGMMQGVPMLGRTLSRAPSRMPYVAPVVNLSMGGAAGPASDYARFGARFPGQMQPQLFRQTTPLGGASYGYATRPGMQQSVRAVTQPYFGSGRAAVPGQSLYGTMQPQSVAGAVFATRPYYNPAPLFGATAGTTAAGATAAYASVRPPLSTAAAGVRYATMGAGPAGLMGMGRGAMPAQQQHMNAAYLSSPAGSLSSMPNLGGLPPMSMAGAPLMTSSAATAAAPVGAPLAGPAQQGGSTWGDDLLSLFD